MYILPVIVFMYHTGGQVVISCSEETGEDGMIVKVISLNHNNTNCTDVYVLVELLYKLERRTEFIVKLSKIYILHKGISSNKVFV